MTFTIFNKNMPVSKQNENIYSFVKITATSLVNYIQIVVQTCKLFLRHHKILESKTIFLSTHSLSFT